MWIGGLSMRHLLIAILAAVLAIGGGTACSGGNQQTPQGSGGPGY